MSLETDAAIFLKKYEGYISKAAWDVNAYRLGHGSDTITLPDGSYRKVVKGDITTREDAQRDLERRLKNEFIPKVEKQVGETQWNNLPDKAKIALISFAYNYGSISKKAILDAVKSGDMDKISRAIVDSTYNDNPKLPESTRNVLRKRRSDEAGMVSSAWQDLKQGIKSNVSKETYTALQTTYHSAKRNILPASMVVLGIVGLSITGYLLIKQGGFKTLFGK